MSRPQQRAPKGRDLDRLDRRNVIANLLARVHRVRLTSPEATLLGDYVREEERAADAMRSSLAGTTRALERNRQAADDAIREAEQRAEQAEDLLRAAHECSNEAERHRADAEQRRAAQQARAATLDHLAHLAREERTRADATLQRVRDAESLAVALAAVAEYDGLTPQAARMSAAFAVAAEHPDARLAEQKRDHDIELARRARTVVLWQNEGREARAHAHRYRDAWMSARRRARTAETELERIRGWAGHWAARTRIAEPRLDRLALAWRSARRRAQERTRDAYANGDEYRTLRAEYDQQLAAIEARAAEQIAYAGPDLPF